MEILRCRDGTRGGARIGVHQALVWCGEWCGLRALRPTQFSRERAHTCNAALRSFYESAANNKPVSELFDLAHMRGAADAEAKHQGQSARSRTNAGNETCEVGRQVRACARYPGYRD